MDNLAEREMVKGSKVEPVNVHSLGWESRQGAESREEIRAEGRQGTVKSSGPIPLGFRTSLTQSEPQDFPQRMKIIIPSTQGPECLLHSKTHGLGATVTNLGEGRMEFKPWFPVEVTATADPPADRTFKNIIHFSPHLLLLCDTQGLLRANEAQKYSWRWGKGGQLPTRQSQDLMLHPYYSRIGPLPQTHPLGHNLNLSHLLKPPQDCRPAPSSPWGAAQGRLGE